MYNLHDLKPWDRIEISRDESGVIEKTEGVYLSHDRGTNTNVFYVNLETTVEPYYRSVMFNPESGDKIDLLPDRRPIGDEWLKYEVRTNYSPFTPVIAYHEGWLWVGNETPETITEAEAVDWTRKKD